MDGWKDDNKGMIEGSRNVWMKGKMETWRVGRMDKCIGEGL